mmetsp:Transcript_17049/g.43779  ORF Transcript_17049/g.43779 Transcript_17049/m.43779 type:complete len:223 (-) Transcript_17049:725-1393(-)
MLSCCRPSRALSSSHGPQRRTGVRGAASDASPSFVGQRRRRQRRRGWRRRRCHTGARTCGGGEAVSCVRWLPWRRPASSAVARASAPPPTLRTKAPPPLRPPQSPRPPPLPLSSSLPSKDKRQAKERPPRPPPARPPPAPPPPPPPLLTSSQLSSLRTSSGQRTQRRAPSQVRQQWHVARRAPAARYRVRWRRYSVPECHVPRASGEACRPLHLPSGAMIPG